MAFPARYAPLAGRGGFLAMVYRRRVRSSHRRAFRVLRGRLARARLPAIVGMRLEAFVFTLKDGDLPERGNPSHTSMERV